MAPSPELLAFVKAWEGCALMPYADSAGYMTVGYGHKLPRAAPREAITMADANRYFEADMGNVAHALTMFAPEDLKQCEFDALCSFAFNVGVSAVRDSTLLRKLADGDVNGAAAEFTKWSHAGGRVVDGILKRRRAEARIFSEGDYSGRP